MELITVVITSSTILSTLAKESNNKDGKNVIDKGKAENYSDGSDNSSNIDDDDFGDSNSSSNNKGNKVCRCAK